MIALALVSAPLMLAGTAIAKTTSQCVSQHASCMANCERYPAGPFDSSCIQRCGSQLDACLANALTVNETARKRTGVKCLGNLCNTKVCIGPACV